MSMNPFDSGMMRGNPLDPNGLIAPIQQGALNQTAMAENQLRNLMKIYQGAGSGLSPELRAAQLYPDAPDLKFGGNGRHWSDALTAGGSNFLNNYQQLKNYRRRTEMLNGAVLEQRKREQDQTDMLRRQEETANTRRTNGRGHLSQEEQVFFDSLSPEEQDKILVKRATGKADAAMAPDQGRAEGEKAIAERTALIEELKKLPPLEVKNAKGEMVPNPAGVRAYSELMARNPYLTLDANQDYIETQQANVNLKSSQNDLQAQPGELKRKATSEQLDISKKQVEVKYADAMALIDKLTGENKLEEAKELKTRLTEGRPLYEQALANWENLTPGQIKLMNSKFKSMNTPFELPEKKEEKNELKPLKNKGVITGWYDDAGHQYNADRSPK